LNEKPKSNILCLLELLGLNGSNKRLVFAGYTGYSSRYIFNTRKWLKKR
jgi:hypothetical protein